MTQNWDPQAYGKNGAFVHQLADGVVEWLALQPDEHVLDLGCGDGALTERLAATCPHVRGVDSSSKMAAAARARGLQIDEANAEALPYREGEFDAVFSNAALHWVRDQDAMLREVRRVLRPGGRFVAEMGGHGNIAAIRVALIAALEQHGLGHLENDVNYYPTPEAYTKRLERAGLRVEKIALIPRPTPLTENGMTGWLRTFRSGVLDQMPDQVRDAVVAETTALLERALRDEDGNWVADYVRLRFIARA
ncbi:MAG TPA: methyltransferase domain-containing protein [Terracidiphilus sp.]|jgi:trans-aconitate methyltransferase|nr:methyltransferase domain-containing protein [Terracidiphilus sp.]